MNKALLLSLMLILSFLLAACDPTHISFDHDELVQEVDRVELVFYENDYQISFKSWVVNHSSRLLSFDLDHMTIIETLSTYDMPLFITQLSDLEFLYAYYTFNSPKGTCIRVVYQNGEFEIFSIDHEHKSFRGYIGRYTSDGEVISFLGSFISYYDFENLINNFFENKLE